MKPRLSPIPVPAIALAFAGVSGLPCFAGQSAFVVSGDLSWEAG